MQQNSKPIKIFFAGDFCSKPSTSIISVSDELKNLIQSCDIKVINFEVPLKPEAVSLSPQKRERFFQSDDVPDFLRNIGFNLFQIANNHIFDWGEEGYIKTKSVLGESAFGAGTYDEANEVKVVEIDGVRIGFLALCFSAYTGVFNDVTKRDGLGCAYINDLYVNHVIIESKKNVDYLFILPHNGIEYIDIPLPETIAKYRDFIDFGADGIIGTHPHCPQGWECYKGKPIFYSLGNFLFNSKEGYDYRATNRPHWYEGLSVVIIVSNGIISWQVYNTRNVDNIGIEIDHSNNRDSHNAQICNYLSNKESYYNCLRQVCNELGQKELSIIDKTFHSNSLKECTRKLLCCWINRIKGKEIDNNSSLERLLSHDARRDLLQWTLKGYHNFK